MNNHTVILSNNPGIHGEDAEKNPWSSWGGPEQLCANCGASINRGYARGKRGEEDYFCSKHITLITQEELRKREMYQKDFRALIENVRKDIVFYIDAEQSTLDVLGEALETLRKMEQVLTTQFPFLVFIRHKEEGENYHLYSVLAESKEMAEQNALVKFQKDLPPDYLEDWRATVIQPEFAQIPKYLMHVERDA